MSPVAEVLVGLVILVGLIGVVVPILPGTLLVFGAILVWAIMTGGATAWTVFALSTLALVVTGIVKYTWPGKRMKSGSAQPVGGGRRRRRHHRVLRDSGRGLVPRIHRRNVFRRTSAAAPLRHRLVVDASRGEGSRIVHAGGTVRALIAAGLWLGAVAFT